MQETREIAVHLIQSNRYQPRLNFDDTSLKELATSIKENGLIQPISVRPIERGFEIIAGERRFRAMVILGYTAIPCIISKVDDTQLAEMALVENIQREDLSAIEEAKAFLVMIENQALTQDKIAQKMGKSQSSVANKIRLLQLPQEIQDAVSTHQITERHARALLAADPAERLGIFNKVVGQNLNVRQTEALIEHHATEPKRKPITKGITRNLQIAVNTIIASIKMIEKTGIKLDYKQTDKEDAIEFVIRFKK
ncbi:MAG: chromosome partitioning protein ParB family [Erysipelotrichaceae bacterium]|nr:MAG: chromosome partitioning protein ParB [Erysipelotrichaceae bacterium]TXT19602.1 MAG: chromosome partitioning protein ParB family [Erysipelotrichaceae bacterium]